MPLNKEGIETLKADLRHDAMRYKQSTFGQFDDDCGTQCCLAGMCLLRKVGQQEFHSIVRDAIYNMDKSEIYNLSMQAAAEQLGIELLTDHQYFDLTDETCMPPIFAETDCWPEDLEERYYDAYSNYDYEAAVEVACEALDRIDVHGMFIK